MAWTLPLVLAALWALCLVLPTGMLHPHPLVQVGLDGGLSAGNMLGSACMVDTSGTTCSGQGKCCIVLCCGV